MADYRDIVMVAGIDPYPERGILDVNKAFVRGAGEAGCVNWDTKEKQEYVK